MAASRLGNALSLKQFMRRRNVLELYRRMMKTVSLVDDKSHQNELKDWIRSEFKQQKFETDEAVINIHMTRGEKALRELTSAIQLAK